MVNSQNIAILSEKVAYLEAAIKNAGIELPEVSPSDNGKALQVVDGAWATGDVVPKIVANPTGEITNDLTGLQIGDTKYNAVSDDEVTFTLAQGITLQNKSIGKVGKLVGGCIKVLGTLPSGEWTIIGDLDIVPSEAISFPFSKSSDGTYGGMADITTEGYVRVYPISAISGTLSFTFSFKSL